MSTLSATIEERIAPSTEEHLRDEVAAEASHGEPPESSAPVPQSWPARVGERIAKRFGQQHLFKLAEQRGEVRKAWHALPARIHGLAQQTKLILELVDDFRSGTYREVPWRSIAIGAAAILYAANPADLVPDALPMLGQLDDLAVLAFALRVMRKDLKAYCAFKGYPLEDYFGPVAH